VCCEVLRHQHANWIIKFGLEEIAIYNVDESIGKSRYRLDLFGMLLKPKIEVLALLPKRQLL
jgi:hypothetical protein